MNQHEPGAKLDEEKPLYATYKKQFIRALKAVYSVSEFGRKKYTVGGWMVVPDAIDRYENAMERHDMAMKSGESIDPESGELHAAHRAWNALAILELTLREASSSD